MEGGNFESGIDRQTSTETGDTAPDEGASERGEEGFHGTLSTESAAIFN